MSEDSVNTIFIKPSTLTTVLMTQMTISILAICFRSCYVTTELSHES
jgi:hypothetical protein